MCVPGRRRRFDECITQCTEQLVANPLDRAVWFIKLKALTNRAFVDDMDMEEEGVAEILMDDNAMQKAPRSDSGSSSSGSGSCSGDGSR